MGRYIGAVPLLFCGTCTILLGCSRSNRFPTAPVHGQVSYQGKAVAGAIVEFLCSGAPRRATGTTDQAGNYRLTTFEPNDGAIIGSHVVTVDVYDAEPEEKALAMDSNAGKSQSKAIEEAMRRSVRQIEKAEKAKPRIPRKYAERRSSDLRKEVVAGQNIINIDLKD